MASTVIVNNMTVVHRTSGGTVQVFPDVCRTPAPPSPAPVPIPYSNIGFSRDMTRGTTTVTCDGSPVMIASSYFATSTGDDPGTLLGVASNAVKGRSEPKLFSIDVKFDGENVVRLMDPGIQNAGVSVGNTPPSPYIQTAATTKGFESRDPEVPEVTRLQWVPGTPIVCGDKVTLEIESVRMEGQVAVPIRIPRRQRAEGARSRTTHDDEQPVLTNNKGSFEWLSRQRAWGKQIDVVAEQTQYKGVQRSNELRMKTVPDAGPEGTEVTPSPNPRDFKPWDAGFVTEIRNGHFVVTRHISWRDGRANPVPGARPTARQLRALKRECQQCWSGVWKLHRVNCERGDTCDCYADNGCCSFLIQVVCAWGPGREPVGWNLGHNSPIGWARSFDQNGAPSRDPPSIFAMRFTNPDHGKWWYVNEWWEERVCVPRTVAAHEFGHLLGLHDEYDAGAVLFDRKLNGPVVEFMNVPESIMNKGTLTFERHFEEMKKCFDEVAEAVIGPTKLIRVPVSRYE